MPDNLKKYIEKYHGTDTTIEFRVGFVVGALFVLESINPDKRSDKKWVELWDELYDEAEDLDNKSAKELRTV